MTAHRDFTIDVSVDEQPSDRTTVARARLRLDDSHQYVGTGTAVRFPRDPEVPSVGDDLAMARALTDLAKQLTGDAYADLDDAGARPWDDA